MTPIDKFIEANGMRLHYLEWPNPEGAALICIHGLTGNAHDFDRVAGRLAKKFRVIALDVRGRGDSQWGPPADYNIPTYAKDLGAMIDALKIERASLIGTSMGGRISILYAADHPGRIERIVLNDIGPALEAATSARINRDAGETPEEFANLDAVVRHFESSAVSIGIETREMVVERATRAVKPTPGGRLTWKTDPLLRKPPPGMTTIRQIDLWEQFKSLRIPILVLRGSESNVFSRRMAERMCELSANTTLVEVPGVGHVPSMEEPEAWAALEKFFGL
jgi:esterase